MIKGLVTDPRIAFLGLASWALPFLLSFLFFDQAGQLTIPKPLFKSLMVVTGGGVGVALLVAAFRDIEPTLWTGFTIGCFWLLLNLALDLLILVPMSGMGFTEYFYDIGLRYFLLPIIAAAMGLVAQRKV